MALHVVLGGVAVAAQVEDVLHEGEGRAREPGERVACETLITTGLVVVGGEITTEIKPAGPFYYAEDYHQQYLAKNPNGYCGLGGTGVACPVGAGAIAS